MAVTITMYHAPVPVGVRCHAVLRFKRYIPYQCRFLVWFPMRTPVVSLHTHWWSSMQ